MKYIILLIVSIFTFNFAISQENMLDENPRYSSAIVTSVEKFTTDKFHDQFTFSVSDIITKELVNYNSNFYTEYFTVKFDEKNHILTFKMVNQDWKNRTIMRRMFAGLYIDQVNYDGKLIPTEDFFKLYVYTTDEIPAK